MIKKILIAAYVLLAPMLFALPPQAASSTKIVLDDTTFFTDEEVNGIKDRIKQGHKLKRMIPPSTLARIYQTAITNQLSGALLDRLVEGKKGVSVSSLQGCRETAEDAIDVYTDGPWAAFAVYDGHGGEQTSQALAGNRPYPLLQTLVACIKAAHSAGAGITAPVNELYKQIDMGLRSIAKDSGSTATICVLNTATQQGWFINLGDSRSIAIKNGTLTAVVTKDHKPICTNDHRTKEERRSDPFNEKDNPCDCGGSCEVARIRNLGGHVKDDRVCGLEKISYPLSAKAEHKGLLAVSRAFGDFGLKQGSNPDLYHVSSQPDITPFSLSGITDIFLGCDGVWDVISNELMPEILEEAKKYTNPAEFVCKTALKMGSGDNISAIHINISEFLSIRHDTEDKPAVGGAGSDTSAAFPAPDSLENTPPLAKHLPAAESALPLLEAASSQKMVLHNYEFFTEDEWNEKTGIKNRIKNTHQLGAILPGPLEIFSQQAIKNQFPETLLEGLREGKGAVSAYSLQGCEKIYKSKIDVFRHSPWVAFAVYDGHTTSETSQALVQNERCRLLPRLIECISRAEGVDLEASVRKLYEDIDKKLDENLTKLPSRHGSTATICVLNTTTEQGWFINLGDSRSIAIKKGNLTADLITTRDHKPICHKLSYPLGQRPGPIQLCPCSSGCEVDRIRKAGGSINGKELIAWLDRSLGYLEVSRSFGHFFFKKHTTKPDEFYVGIYPDITSFSLSDITDIFLGCDGVWNTISNESMPGVITKAKKYENPAEFVCKTALKKGSNDNISGILINVPQLLERVRNPQASYSGAALDWMDRSYPQLAMPARSLPPFDQMRAPLQTASRPKRELDDISFFTEHDWEVIRTLIGKLRMPKGALSSDLRMIANKAIENEICPDDLLSCLREGKSAVSAYALQGYRKTNEDALDVYINGPWAAFAIYDGHNGSRTSQALAQNEQLRLLPSVVECIKAAHPSHAPLEGPVSALYKQVDEGLKKVAGGKGVTDYIRLEDISSQVEMSSGSTATICVLNTKTEQGWFINLGDSRSIAIKGGAYEQVTQDHKPICEKEAGKDEKNSCTCGGSCEVARIHSLGGHVKENRICQHVRITQMGKVVKEKDIPSLAVSRAFGDFELKQGNNPDNYHVSIQPDITSFRLNGITDILLGCDGVWDVIPNKSMPEILKEAKKYTNPAEYVCKTALNKGSIDNISAIHINLCEFLENMRNPHTRRALEDSGPVAIRPKTVLVNPKFFTKERLAEVEEKIRRGRTLRGLDLTRTTNTRADQLPCERLRSLGEAREAVSAYDLEGYKASAKDTIDMYTRGPWVAFAMYEGYKGDAYATYQGSEISQALSHNTPHRLLPQLIECISKEGINLEETINKLYQDIDRNLEAVVRGENPKLKNSASSATVCVLNRATQQGWLINLGSLRSIAIKDNASDHVVTTDHKPLCTNDKRTAEQRKRDSIMSPKSMCTCDKSCEFTRISNTGGFLKDNLVYKMIPTDVLVQGKPYSRETGGLPVSRAFGCLQFKKDTTPDRYTIGIQPDIKPFSLDGVTNIFLGSRGVWDVVSNELMPDVLKKASEHEDPAEYVCKTALKMGSGDNISGVIIDVPKLLRSTYAAEERPAVGGAGCSSEERQAVDSADTSNSAPPTRRSPIAAAQTPALRLPAAESALSLQAASSSKIMLDHTTFFTKEKLDAYKGRMSNLVRDDLLSNLGAAQRAVSAYDLVGGRDTAEDEIDVYRDGPWAAFAVYDGHGDTQTSQALALNPQHRLLPRLVATIKAAVNLGLAEIESRVSELYKEIDASLQRIAERNGSTATICVLNTATQQGWFINLGDSRSIAIKNGTLTAVVTKDHKPICTNDHRTKEERRSDPFNEKDNPCDCGGSCEVARIRNLGGHVKNDRVCRLEKTRYSRAEEAKYWGLLAVSRAFGDFELKGGSNPDLYHVSSQPDITPFSLSDITDIFLGCDGVWDVISNELMPEILEEAKKYTNPAEFVCKTALKMGSGDNISGVVIDVPELLRSTYAAEESPAVGGAGCSSEERPTTGGARSDTPALSTAPTRRSSVEAAQTPALRLPAAEPTLSLQDKRRRGAARSKEIAAERIRTALDTYPLQDDIPDTKFAAILQDPELCGRIPIPAPAIKDLGYAASQSKILEKLFLGNWDFTRDLLTGRAGRPGKGDAMGDVPSCVISVSQLNDAPTKPLAPNMVEAIEPRGGRPLWRGLFNVNGKNTMLWYFPLKMMCQKLFDRAAYGEGDRQEYAYFSHHKDLLFEQVDKALAENTTVLWHGTAGVERSLGSLIDYFKTRCPDITVYKIWSFILSKRPGALSWQSLHDKLLAGRNEFLRAAVLALCNPPRSP